MHIRRAEEKDIPRVDALLYQVLAIHAEIRPDIFIPGTKKYSDEELRALFRDPGHAVFVAEDDSGFVTGYCFCELQRPPHSDNMTDILTLYIDDLCVDQECRGQHVGRQLYEHALAFAKQAGCYNVTLNVWEGNDSARRFYEKSGFGIQKTCMEIILK